MLSYNFFDFLVWTLKFGRWLQISISQYQKWLTVRVCWLGKEFKLFFATLLLSLLLILLFRENRVYSHHNAWLSFSYSYTSYLLNLSNFTLSLQSIWLHVSFQNKGKLQTELLFVFPVSHLLIILRKKWSNKYSCEKEHLKFVTFLTTSREKYCVLYQLIVKLILFYFQTYDSL